MRADTAIQRGYGATAAHLTPDQKVGNSNLSALIIICLDKKHNASLQRARGVVVSHPLSMREALGSIPSVSILVHHAGAGRKGKTNGAQAARPAIMAPRQLSPQSGQREYSGLGKLADCCAPWGVAVQRNRRAHQTPALSEISSWPVVLPRSMVLICAVGSSIQAEWANWTGKLSGQTGRANRSANKAGKPSARLPLHWVAPPLRRPFTRSGCPSTKSPPPLSRPPPRGRPSTKPLLHWLAPPRHDVLARFCFDAQHAGHWRSLGSHSLWACLLGCSALSWNN